MAKNKLYNKSYFCKRLIQSGFAVTKLDITFQKDDYRRWVILVNPRKGYRYNILVTCFKDQEDFSFKFQGQNFNDFILNSKSMKLIIDIFIKAFNQKEEQTTNE